MRKEINILSIAVYKKQLQFNFPNSDDNFRQVFSYFGRELTEKEFKLIRNVIKVLHSTFFLTHPKCNSVNTLFTIFTKDNHYSFTIKECLKYYAEYLIFTFSTSKLEDIVFDEKIYVQKYYELAKENTLIYYE